ncbi:MAG TPA: hypothetical protein VEA38_00900 [Terriglobales bacterium]|nr:hypothetical protein [Terriglobales bacterium]
MNRVFQVSDASVPAINNMGREIRDAMDEVLPIQSAVLYPSGRALPTGWVVADGTGGRPDLRAFGIANYVYIVRLR